MIKGIIINYRRGRKSQYRRQFVIEAAGIDSRKKALSLVGKKVFWKSMKGKTITGKVINAHGGKGAVRVRFSKGLPGEAIFSKVLIAGESYEMATKKEKKK